MTTWGVTAPVEAAFAAIHDTRSWPEWWHGIEDVREIEPGAGDGLGAIFHMAWRSRLPYTVEFDMRVTRVEPPWVLEGAAKGELEGRGTWRFAQARGAALVSYEWDVVTTRRWMSALAPVARPVFSWNHDVLMRRGGIGLAQRLGARLVLSA